MKILDRYTAKGFAISLFYCLLVFYMLYIVADILGHLDDILRNKVPFMILVKFYLSFTPIIYVQTLPIAALLATVYLLSDLNKNNELTAIKASGINVAFTLRPIFFIGIILCLSIFYVNENLIPKASLLSSKIKTEYFEHEQKDKKLEEINDLTIYGKANQMIYAKKFDPEKNKLTNIIILENDKDQNLKRKIIAQSADWINDRWVFSNVIIFRFDKYGQPAGKILRFKEKIIRLPEKPHELLKGEFITSLMNYPQLKTYIGRLKGGDKRTIDRLKTDLHFKLSLPFVVFIMILLGIPFAMTTARGGVAASIGISIVVGLIYYASIGISLALGKGNILPPIIAAHLSNVVFFCLAIVLIRRAPD